MQKKNLEWELIYDRLRRADAAVRKRKKHFGIQPRNVKTFEDFLNAVAVRGLVEYSPPLLPKIEQDEKESQNEN